MIRVRPVNLLNIIDKTLAVIGRLVMAQLTQHLCDWLHEWKGMWF